MVTLLVIFATAVIAGMLFWLYNRRQVLSLTEQVEDKTAVINAFRSYSEGANSEWNGSSPSENVNLTPTVDEVLSRKNNRNGKNSNNGNTKRYTKKSSAQQSNQSSKKNQKPQKAKKQN